MPAIPDGCVSITTVADLYEIWYDPRTKTRYYGRRLVLGPLGPQQFPETISIEDEKYGTVVEQKEG